MILKKRGYWFEMNIKALLSTESMMPKAQSLSIQVDNIKMKDLRIESSITDGFVNTIIECNRAGTLLSTLDDILRCQIISEEMMLNG